MDSVDVNTVATAGDNKWRVNKKNRDWHKRLHLRKAAVQPPTMQSEDKRGPKKIAEEWEQNTVWPSSKKPPQEAQQRTNDNGNTLRFKCFLCKDNLEYVPKDLVRHFEENHRGSSPVFGCHVCTFSTHEFSYLQVHLLSHKDTFSSCSICNDNVQRTWSEFSTHLTMCHSQNGKYSCEACQKFSTGDVGVFVQHMYAHNLGLDERIDDLLLHTKDTKKLGPETTSQTLRCQHCDFEASQKWLLTKHIKTFHGCPNGNASKRKKESHSFTMNPNDPIPKMKPRLTRSAVREMCWLTQDCLSLPGREFLDKYCHLSDPQTTLEETQQFLMKSVTGETGDQKWTKALKTVLSNVPQDVTPHAKSENGIVTNSSDLTVLTVKNKITVAQNGATYAKKLKVMTSSDKETGSPEGAPADARCAVDVNGCQSNWNDHTSCLQVETKLNNDIAAPAQNELSECAQMQENRENQEVQTDQETEEHGRKHEEPMHEDGISVSGELKLTTESTEQTSKAVPKRKRQYRRRKRKAKSKREVKITAGSALKIVLRKNPVKEKQWVSQSSLSPPGGGLTEVCHAPSEEMGPQQKKWTKASKSDPSKAIISTPELKPGAVVTLPCAAKPQVFHNTDTNTPVLLESLQSMHQKVQDHAETSVLLSDTEVEMSGTAGGTDQVESRATAVTGPELDPMKLQAPASGHVSDAEMASWRQDGGSCTKSSPLSQPAVTPLVKSNYEDLSPSPLTEQSRKGIRDREVPADACSGVISSINSPAVKAIQQEPSPASTQPRQPVPKNLERTLNLVAISPYQLVKRPAGKQPVVVLNHPDADIPEVARIMEVINRYKGEVQKVILSRKTLLALSAKSNEVPDPADDQGDSRHGKSSVQERFILKLKLRRLSRKKYEVVGAVSPSRESAATFRCWFCGRVLASHDMWMVHRQRHLMEWK
ncbi:uncharacterized protein V6R79_022614 [Siganus canaliculatus]